MTVRPVARRLLLALAAAVLAVAAGWSGAQDSTPAGPVALLAAIEGPIGPATVHHIENVVELARERDTEILVLRIDTPGGLATSMREIIEEILASPVPVAGYVAPPGAHAASAGTYILYATHIAAMAPGTNLGAATPVQIGGGIPGLPRREGGDEDKQDDTPDDEADDKKPPMGGEAMSLKAVNDAVAFIRSLAEMHGRNADWAEQAVREAASLSAMQALELGMIDYVADDVEALLAAVDGRTVTAGSVQHTLATKGLPVEQVEVGMVTQALAILANPNVAFILLMVGVYGLIFEFSQPGTIGPGVVGVICLVLGLFALNQLPLNYAGLALLIIGIAFMVAEAVTPAFGILGIGGLIAFIIGAAMLVDTEAPEYQLSWWVIGGTAAVSGAVLVLLLGFLWRVYWRTPKRDAARMVGAEGQVIDWSGNEEHVWAESERWQARGDTDLAEGDAVRIRKMEGLTLIVGRADADAVPEEPVQPAASDSRRDEGD